MAYRIKVFAGGLMKLDIFEGGEKVRRKLRQGEVVEVETVDENEMEAGYYKVIRPELATQKIQREPQKVLQPSGQAQQLSELIDGMKTMINVAEEVLGAINKTAEQPKQKEPIQVPVKDQDGQEIRSDHTISENESQKDIYDQKNFRKGNEQYQRLVENTAVFMIGGQSRDRSIHKIGDIASKKMPKISEATLGKMDRKSIPAVLDSKGEIANKNNPGRAKVDIVSAEKGDIDVVKALGIKLVNKPGQGFNIDRSPGNGNSGGGIDI